MSSTNKVIQAKGRKKTSCLRPPYGATDGSTRSRASSLGMKVVLWDVDTQDWRRPGASTIANHAIRNARTGHIILMHDAGGDRSQSVAALKTILSTLTTRGFSFAALPCS